MDSNHTILSQMIADFVIRVELGQYAYFPDHAGFSQKLTDKKCHLNARIDNVSAEIGQFKAMMTRAKIKQWREQSEKIYADNQREINSLHALYHQTLNTMTTQCENLNRASMTTVKNVAKLVDNAKQSVIQDLSKTKILEQSLTFAKDNQKNFHYFLRASKLFQLKNLVLILMLNVMSAVIMNLYINDQLPWQSREQVAKQRSAGRILNTAWKQLSPHNQQIIMQNA